MNARRREQIAEIQANALQITSKLDRQDAGQTELGRKASDRGAFLRFVNAVKTARLSKILKADLKADRFSWNLDEHVLQRQEALDGKLILLTNVRDLSATKVVERYKSLADIERGFRVLKQDISIAPVHHRLPERIRAHALICFLALLLYRVMRPKLSDQSPGAALRELKALQLHQLKTAERTLCGLTATPPKVKEILIQLQLPLPNPNALNPEIASL